MNELLLLPALSDAGKGVLVEVVVEVDAPRAGEGAEGGWSVLGSGVGGSVRPSAARKVEYASLIASIGFALRAIPA